jgi:hypothetical protein
MHCTKNPSVADLYILRIGLPDWLQQNRQTDPGNLFLKKNIFWGIFSFCSYNIQGCFICRPSDSTVPTDAEIVHWQSDALTTKLDLILGICKLLTDIFLVQCMLINDKKGRPKKIIVSQILVFKYFL